MAFPVRVCNHQKVVEQKASDGGRKTRAIFVEHQHPSSSAFGGKALTSLGVVENHFLDPTQALQGRFSLSAVILLVLPTAELAITLA